MIFILGEEDDSATHQVCCFRIQDPAVMVVQLDVLQLGNAELWLLAACAVCVGKDYFAVLNVDAGCQHGNQNNQSQQKDDDGQNQWNGPDDGAAGETL